MKRYLAAAVVFVILAAACWALSAGAANTTITLGTGITPAICPGTHLSTSRVSSVEVNLNCTGVTTTTVPPTTTTTVPPTTTTTVPPTTTTTTQPSTGLAPPSGYATSQLAFDDQFSGTTLNGAKWHTALAGEGGDYWNGAGLPAGFSATGHTGQTVYDPARCVVDNGLSLTMTYDPTYSALGYQTRSCALSTFDKFTFTTGYVQVRAEMPDTSLGQWPAIWLLPNGSTSGSEEIDMHEGGMWPGGYGYANGTPLNEAFAPNYHTPSGAQPLVLSDTTPVVPDLTGWHTYGMELNAAAQTVKFYIDGVLYATQTGSVPTEPWELILNLAEVAPGVGLWHQPCPTNMATLPSSVMHVSEVQVYG